MRENNRDCVVRITTSTSPIEEAIALDVEKFDVGILYGNGHWSGMHSDLIFLEKLTPVCTPSLKQSVLDASNLSNKGAVSLLHSTTDHRDWRLWLNQFPNSAFDPNSGIAFETMDNAINAAIAGHGTTLGDISLIEDKVISGQLAQIYEETMLSGKGYYFVCHSDALQIPKIKSFRYWLLSQIEQ